jgi:prepilin peptidase CpaA
MMITTLILLIILGICVVTDIKERKIYNVVIFPALLLAFFIQGIDNGLLGLKTAGVGFLVGFGLLLVPYFLGGMGAGDVKLLGLIGALKGASFVMYTAIYMGIIGALMALGIILFRSGAMTAVIYGVHSARNGIRVPIKEGVFNSSYTYPYGVAIAMGALAAIALERWIVLW